ncbi:MAG: hypothetical protein ACRD1O_13120 [Terriglobia bacterium]
MGQQPRRIELGEAQSPGRSDGIAGDARRQTPARPLSRCLQSESGIADYLYNCLLFYQIVGSLFRSRPPSTRSVHPARRDELPGSA